MINLAKISFFKLPRGREGGSSSSAFPAMSLGFTFFSEIFVYVIVEVVTFHLHG